MKTDEQSTKNAFDLMEDIDFEDVSKPTTIETNNFFDIPLVVDDNAPVTIEKEEEEKTAPVDEKVEGDEEDQEPLKVVELKTDYDQFNEFALIALTRIKDGKWDLDEKEIPKDLDPTTLMDLIDAQETANQEKYQKDLYEQAGEYATYIKYLMDGGSKEVVADAISVKQITLLDPSTEENQKQILTAYLELKGVEEDIIEDTIETLLDKGKAQEKSQEAIEALKKYEENIIASKQREAELAAKRQEEEFKKYVNDVTTLVKKGKVGGITVDAKRQTQIIDALFKPTEIEEFVNPRTGEKQKQRVTKARKLFNEVNTNPEKLASMVLWLLDGGNFESIKDEIKEKKDDSLREILKGRKTATVINRQVPSANGFEVLAKYIDNN